MFFVVLVPAWMVYAFVLWTILCGIILIGFFVILLRAIQARTMTLEAEEPEEKPGKLIILNSDKMSY